MSCVPASAVRYDSILCMNGTLTEVSASCRNVPSCVASFLKAFAQGATKKIALARARDLAAAVAQVVEASLTN